MSRLRIRVIFTTDCCHGLSSMKSALFHKLAFHLAVLIKKEQHVLKKECFSPSKYECELKNTSYRVESYLQGDLNIKAAVLKQQRFISIWQVVNVPAPFSEVEALFKECE